MQLEKKVFKIVLTGGPCSGKTTALAILAARFSEKGYKVITVPESATTLISGFGISPMEYRDNSQWWNYIFQYQMTCQQVANEMIAEAAADAYTNADPCRKVIILCDRGILDQCAYIDREELEKGYGEVVNTFTGGTGPVSLDNALARYDAVIHLVTAAIGARDSYNLGNKARSESPELAADLDRKTMAAWVGHPHLRIVSNQDKNFQQKMEQVVKEISDVLGDPVPTEREYKYLIKKPTAEQLKEAGAVKSRIVQTYLRPGPGGEERRVRQRSVFGGHTFFYTEKLPTGKTGERIEREQKIPAEEYLRLLNEADPTAGVIVKERYCFVYADQYFELDIYVSGNAGKDRAILEIELSEGCDEDVKLPGFIEVIKDVTGDPVYSNYALARAARRKEAES